MGPILKYSAAMKILISFQKGKKVPALQNATELYIKTCLNGYYCWAVHQLSRTKSRPAKIYLLKVRNRNTRKICEICSKLSQKTPARCHSSVLLLTLNIFHTFF